MPVVNVKGAAYSLLLANKSGTGVNSLSLSQSMRVVNVKGAVYLAVVGVVV